MKPSQNPIVEKSAGHRKDQMTKYKQIFVAALISIFLALGLYYFYPISKIPGNIIIDNIVVLKSKHQLLAYSQGRLIVIYKISIGKNPVGNKEFEGDQKTPEGIYKIESKNPHSAFHKNLGISYPNERDVRNSRQLGKLPGGDIKLHGLKNGQEYLGKFQRWMDWTNGCIALTNDEMDELYDHTHIGTRIEIRK